MKKSLSTPIRFVKGIGPRRAKIFKKCGIETVEDILYYFPRRYEDRTNLCPIAKIKEGEVQTIKAKVLIRGERSSFRRRGFSITEVVVGDGTGKIFCVWFNQPYLKDYFKVGSEVILYGKVERYQERLQMNSPEFEIIDENNEDSLDTRRIVPVYALPERITQRSFRKLIKHILDEYLSSIIDFLPYDIRSRNELLNLAKSLLSIHFPKDEHERLQAYKRLSFEEFFLFQLPLALRKLKRKEKKGIVHKTEGTLLTDFISRLPFKLTQSQEKVINEIKLDMHRPFVMQRLLQGDVGSGKTVVATIASIIAIQSGYQAAFMVPTELLAKQHFEKISTQTTGLKSWAKEIKIGLLTSSSDNKEKEKIYQEIKEGRIDLVIGTHALLEEQVGFKNLGLVVIDEQHKFGVAQRALLPKKGANPDILIMTATPIPRTLAITLYGDLDISVINGLPPGRKPVKTLRFNQEARKEAYKLVKGELKKGRQAYIVYPVIEESYTLDISGAEKMFEELKRGEFKEFRLGLIHGRLKEKQQDRIMKDFKEKKLDMLISTTVLEVGIDIANATCMVIEHAQRFGLAQLHQLRGRVGRGAEESFCILISDAGTLEAEARLKAMVEYSDGFKIAEQDLRIRGPGEFFGRHQHGLTELKIGNPLVQTQLLKRAREEAIRLVTLDPKLELTQDALLKQRLLQRFPEYEKLMLAP
ncbi:MAG: ATP-dependent DNA helicase RecG [Candidatus Omnitrophica bacterium]|nr:ATP-dependent DNA helicase RecG [Candidatus Omnitrophota bacterium]